MLRKSIQLIVAVAIVTFAAALAANAQTNIQGRYVYMYENTTDEGGVALFLADKEVAIWKNIEDGEERRYERKGTWKLSENGKVLTINFPKDQSRYSDLQSEPFEISFAVSETELTVKKSGLPGIKPDETVFKKE